jgi:hypothetical protein
VPSESASSRCRALAVALQQVPASQADHQPKNAPAGRWRLGRFPRCNIRVCSFESAQ